MNDVTRTSKEWNTPWRTGGFAVYDTKGNLVAHTGITGNRSMRGEQLERLATMIADAVNAYSAHTRPLPNDCLNDWDLENVRKEMENRGWKPDSKGDPDCVDQASAMAEAAIRELQARRASHEPPAEPAAYQLRKDGKDYGLFTPAEFRGSDSEGFEVVPLFTSPAQPPRVEETQHFAFDVDQKTRMHEVLDHWRRNGLDDEWLLLAMARAAQPPLVCIGQLIQLDDGVGTVFADWNEERFKLPPGTKLYASAPTKEV